MIVVRRELLTGELVQKEIQVDSEDYARWRLGVGTLPLLSDWDREFLVSGLTRESWERAFRGEAA